MAENNMVGNKNGIALWNIMASTDSALEKEYFVRLSNAASKFGTVWFSDLITQKETGKNQTIWQISWLADRSVWEVTKFHIPDGVKEASQRIKDYQNVPEEVIELSVDDMLIDEE